MPRPLRLQFPGAVYHVMSRGDRRRDIFCDDIDRRRFLDTLAKEVAQQRWRLYAYCLMGNHYQVCCSKHRMAIWWPVCDG